MVFGAVQAVQVVAPAADQEPAAHKAQAVTGATPPAPNLPAAQMVHPVLVRVSYPVRHFAHSPAAASLHLSHPFGAVARVPVQVADWVLMN